MEALVNHLTALILIFSLKDVLGVKTGHFYPQIAKAFDCVDHNKLENSERDGNTRAPDLPLEKPVCRSGSNS